MNNSGLSARPIEASSTAHVCQHTLLFFYSASLPGEARCVFHALRVCEREIRAASFHLPLPLLILPSAYTVNEKKEKERGRDLESKEERKETNEKAKQRERGTSRAMNSYASPFMLTLRKHRLYS